MVSGVSGSGKSTHVLNVIMDYMKGLGMTAEQMMSSPMPTATVSLCSADSFFEVPNEGGPPTYNFDASKLSEAHGKCFRDFITALTSNVELVVVDNTNTTVAEVAPYFLGAQAYGYDIDLITVMCETDADIKLCAARNTHNVPEGGIFAQHRRLCARELMPWWKNTFQPVVR